MFNEIPDMLQFYLIFYSQDCYWMSWRDFQKVIKVGLSPSKKILCYLLDLKPFRSYEKCILFHLKSSFRSQDI